MKLKIRKGATVKVLAGADKGKTGAVLEVLPEKMMVRVQGVRLQTHFSKQDGISKREGLLHYSNVMMTDAAPAKKKVAKKAAKEKSA